MRKECCEAGAIPLRPHFLWIFSLCYVYEEELCCNWSQLIVFLYILLPLVNNLIEGEA